MPKYRNTRASSRAPNRKPLSPGELSLSLYAPPEPTKQQGTPSVTIAPAIPPAITGPHLGTCGAPFDEWNDWWKGREAALAFKRSREAFAAGLLEEWRRQGVSITTSLVELENEIFAQLRAAR